MTQYIVRRLLLMIPTLLGVVVIVFLLMRIIPGDIAIAILAGGTGQAIDPQDLAMLRHKLGIDKPLIVQFTDYVWGLLRFDLGDSLWFREPVSLILKKTFPLSLEIAVIATAVTTMIAIPVGVISAIRQDTWLDYVLRVISIGGLAVPGFWLGILIIMALVAFFNWMPPLQYKTPVESLSTNLSQLIWPILAVGYRQAAVAVRMTRATMLDVLREDYIRTAWAKGLRERAVVIAHALKNSMLPVLTILGIEFAMMFGGLVVTETVFNVPGMGRALVDGVTRRDYPLVQSIVLVVAIIVLVVNLVVDLMYGLLDPRIRYQ